MDEVYLNRPCILFQVPLSWSTPFRPSHGTRQSGQHLGIALPTLYALQQPLQPLSQLLSSCILALGRLSILSVERRSQLGWRSMSVM